MLSVYLVAMIIGGILLASDLPRAGSPGERGRTAHHAGDCPKPSVHLPSQRNPGRLWQEAPVERRSFQLQCDPGRHALARSPLAERLSPRRPVDAHRAASDESLIQWGNTARR